MKVISLTLAFALIGLGVGGLIMAYSGMYDMIVVILCVLFVSFIGALIGSIPPASSPKPAPVSTRNLTPASSSLIFQSFLRIGDVRGKTIDEIVSLVGFDYAIIEKCTIADRNNEAGLYYRWKENDNVVITLLFGADGKCIGIITK